MHSEGRGHTMMPKKLTVVQNAMRRVYCTLPFEMRGQATFARTAGRILKNVTMPFGVVLGTKSSAADKMIT